jgi:hypothetical protein
MSPSTVRLALVVEMHLLLGPLTLLVAVALMPSVVLGLPHAFGLVAGPVARHDAVTLALMAALLPVGFALSISWTLGMVTTRREIYRFGREFWAAVVCMLLGSGLVAHFIDQRAPVLLVPVWFFLLHMAVLQLRLRARPAIRSSTRSGS